MSASAKAFALLRRTLPYLTVVVIVAVVYDGGIFYSRWSYRRQAEKAEARAIAEDARQTLDSLGGDHLKILNFYATPPAIRRGRQSLICYGTNAAERVRLEPDVEQLHPAVSHCFQVSPVPDTEYKLIAEDRVGHMVTQSLAIKVGP